MKKLFWTMALVGAAAIAFLAYSVSCEDVCDCDDDYDDYEA